MKKYITLTVVAICVLLLMVGCSKDNSKDNGTNETISFPVNSWSDDYPSDYYDDFNQDGQELPTEDITFDNSFSGNVNINQNTNQNSNQNNVGNNTGSNSNQNVNTSVPNQSNNQTSSIPNNPFISNEDISKLENSNAEVYFSDNPNNKYIVKVVNKYGSNADNLIALIKVNATFPSGMVLEFSGKRDANGELVMTYQELKYVYNIDDSKGTIVKASKNGIGNDGISAIESKITFMLMENYFCPNLPNLKANKRYPE